MDQSKDQNQPRPPDTLATFRVEIAPGKFTTIELPRDSVNQFGLVKTVMLNDGTPKIIWKTWAATARITRGLPKSIGLDIDFSTLHILVRAGIVEGSKVSPFTTLINIDSLMRHVSGATGAAARDYWTEERQDAYSEAYEDYHARGMTSRPRRARKQKTAKPQRPARLPAAKAPPPVRRQSAPPPSQQQQQQLDLFSDPPPQPAPPPCPPPQPSSA